MKVVIEEILSNNNVNIEDNSIIHIVHIEEFESVSNHSQLNLDDGTNPHGTTKQDVGLGNVPNLNTTDAVNKAHEHSNISVLNGTEESFTTALKNAYNSAVSWITTNGTNLINHLTNYSNPHNVTKSQVGLGSVDNTSDADKPISNATQEALNNKADLVGGKVPSAQLPSYVDDVEEYANLASFPVTGETGKIYLALDTNKTYRWSGSAYVELGGGANKQIFQWYGGNWNTPTLGNYYYISFNGGAIEGLNTSISMSMNGRNKGLFIAPFNCKIKRVIFKDGGSGSYTGVFVLASGLPNYNGTWNNGYTNIVTHLNQAITSTAYNQNKFEFLVTDNITVPKGYAVCPMLMFTAQAGANKVGIEISIEIEEVV